MKNPNSTVSGTFSNILGSISTLANVINTGLGAVNKSAEMLDALADTGKVMAVNNRDMVIVESNHKLATKMAEFEAMVKESNQ